MADTKFKTLGFVELSYLKGPKKEEVKHEIYSSVEDGIYIKDFVKTGGSSSKVAEVLNMMMSNFERQKVKFEQEHGVRCTKLSIILGQRNLKFTSVKAIQQHLLNVHRTTHGTVPNTLTKEPNETN